MSAMPEVEPEAQRGGFRARLLGALAHVPRAHAEPRHGGAATGFKPPAPLVAVLRVHARGADRPSC